MRWMGKKNNENVRNEWDGMDYCSVDFLLCFVIALLTK